LVKRIYAPELWQEGRFFVTQILQDAKSNRRNAGYTQIEFADIQAVALVITPLKHEPGAKCIAGKARIAVLILQPSIYPRRKWQRSSKHLLGGVPNEEIVSTNRCGEITKFLRRSEKANSVKHRQKTPMKSKLRSGTFAGR